MLFDRIKLFSKNFVCDLGSHFIIPGPVHMGREALKPQDDDYLPLEVVQPEA